MKRAKSLITELRDRSRPTALRRLKREITTLFAGELVWKTTTRMAGELLRRRTLSSHLATGIIKLGLKRPLSLQQARALAKAYAGGSGR